MKTPICLLDEGLIVQFPFGMSAEEFEAYEEWVEQQAQAAAAAKDDTGEDADGGESELEPDDPWAAFDPWVWVPTSADDPNEGVFLYADR